MADDSAEVVKEQSEVVAANDLLVKGNGPAFYTNLLYHNAVRQQDQWAGISNAIATKCADAILNTSPQEGAAPLATFMEMMKAMSSPNMVYPPIAGGNTQGPAGG